MYRGLSYRACAVFAVVVSAVLTIGPTPAPAAPTWVAPVTLAPRSAVIDVATDPNGNSLAVWTEERPIAGEWHIPQALMSSYRSAGGTWSPAVQVGPPVSYSDTRKPSAAFAPDGRAVVTWQVRDQYSKCENGELWAAGRASSGEWSSPVSLGYANDHDLRSDATGRMTLIWDSTCYGNGRLWSSRLAPAGQWSAPVGFSSEQGQDLSTRDYASGASGSAAAFWRLYDGTARASYLPAGGAWEQPQILGQAVPEPPTDVTGGAVAVDVSGGALVVYEDYTGAGDRVLRTLSRPSSRRAWSTSVNPLEHSLGEVAVDVTFTSDGQAVMLLQRREDSTVYTSVLQGGDWSQPVLVPGMTTLPAVSARPDGTLMAVWKAGQTLTSSTWTTGVGWSQPKPVTGEAVAAWGGPSVDGHGDVIVGWTRDETSAVRVSAYDASGPVLHDLTVPDAGIAATPMSFSVRPVDTWSPPATATWSFGDGATAPGPATSHVYAGAGRFTTSVTAVDAVGNGTTGAPKTVVVTAGPGSTPGGPTPGESGGPSAEGRLSVLRYDYELDIRRRNRKTRLTRLTISPLVSGVRAKVSCTGGGCPFKRKSLRPSRRFNIARLFRNRRLRAGTVVEVRLLRDGYAVAVLQLVMRARKGPTVRELCLPAGAARPVKCA